MINLKFNSLKTKRVRYGGYAALVTALAAAGLILLNLVAARIPGDLDLTEHKVFSLSEATAQLVESLETPVNIYALYHTGSEDSDVLKVLEKYKRLSDLITVDVIDPDLQPGFVAHYSTDGQSVSEGSVIVESGTYSRVLAAVDLYDVHYNQQGRGNVYGFAMEQKITAAVQYVASGYTPKIYTLTGHGEESLASYGVDSLAQDENYEISELNLLTEGGIPDDASVLMIIYPKYDISTEEIDVIHAWLQAGGRGIFLFDLIKDELPGFNDLLSGYGLAVQEGVVMDPDKQHHVMVPVYLAPTLAEHPILDPLSKESLNVIAPFGVGIAELDIKPRNIELTPLLTTSEDSFRRIDLRNNAEIKSPGDEDGPVTIAWAVEQRRVTTSDPEGFRILVMGNSQFLGPVKPYGVMKGNVDFFLNTLGWVNEREETITIRSKSLIKLPIRMNALLMYLYALIIVIIIPASILTTGLVIWLKRRHL